MTPELQDLSRRIINLTRLVRILSALVVASLLLVLILFISFQREIRTDRIVITGENGAVRATLGRESTGLMGGDATGVSFVLYNAHGFPSARLFASDDTNAEKGLYLFSHSDIPRSGFTLDPHGHPIIDLRGGERWTGKNVRIDAAENVAWIHFYDSSNDHGYYHGGITIRDTMARLSLSDDTKPRGGQR